MADDVPGVEQAHRRADVGLGVADRLLDGAHRVVELVAGVPERVPECGGQTVYAVCVLGVEQHEVEVAAERELTTSVATEGDDRERVRSEPELGPGGREKPTEHVVRGISSLMPGSLPDRLPVCHHAPWSMSSTLAPESPDGPLS